MWNINYLGVLFSIERESCGYGKHHCMCACFDSVVQMSLYLGAVQILLLYVTPEMLRVCEEPMAVIYWYKQSVFDIS